MHGTCTVAFKRVLLVEDLFLLLWEQVKREAMLFGDLELLQFSVLLGLVKTKPWILGVCQ